MTLEAFDSPFRGNIISTEVKFKNHSNSSSRVFLKVYETGKERIRKIDHFIMGN